MILYTNARPTVIGGGVWSS